MPITIFYSWQTDSPPATNRNFIEGALKKAIKKLQADVELVNSVRDQSLALDKDTKDVPGTPPIVQTIFGKIDECAAFVPDLTFVGKTPTGRPLPNSNVLIEYGWALKSRGHGCIVPVMNTAFGKPSWKTLPFNMRHLRWPLTYELKQKESQQRRSQVREELVKALCTDIRAILRQSLATPGETETFQETKPTYDKAVFFNEGESLAKWEGGLGALHDLHFEDRGAKMFLRIIPTAPVASLTLKQASDLAGRKELRLQPFDYIPTYGGQWYDRNRYGAIAYRTGPREGDPIYQFTQMLKNRELWGVNGEPATWQVPGTEFGVIANGYEAAFVRALGHYLEFARDNLELRPPLRIIGGFTRIEDYRMAAPRGQRFRGLEKYRGRAVEPEIIFESVVQNWETPTEKVLMPFFEDMWHSFGFDERPDVPT